MIRIVPRLVSTLVLAATMALVSVAAYAQGGVTASISGTVVDASGAVIPGAEITVKNNATARRVDGRRRRERHVHDSGAQSRHLHGDGHADGLQDGRPQRRRAQRGHAGRRHTRDARGRRRSKRRSSSRAAVEIVQTQTSTVVDDDERQQISNLPLVEPQRARTSSSTCPASTRRAAVRDSTINGLPQSTINITLDGMSIQDNYLKTTDGFFARLSPRIDAVEEVTVTTAANGADSAGQGAVNIRLVTRSGSNRFARQRLLLPASRRAQREYVVQQPRPDAGSGDRQGAEDRAASVPARHPRRRSDLDSGTVQTAATGRSSSSTTKRRGRRARSRSTANDPASPARSRACSATTRARASSTVDLLAPGGAQRADRRRSIRPSQAARRHPRQRRRQGTISDLGDPNLQEFALPDRGRATTRRRRRCASTTT